MRDSRFFLMFSLLLVIQVLLTSFLNFSQVLTFSLIPAMILCIPIQYTTIPVMLIAFASGFLVDFMSGSPLGLTIASVLPVALLRKPLYLLCFDSSSVSRMEDLSIQRVGFMRILICCMLGTLVSLVIYVWIDGAGTRSFLFNLMRFLVSFGVNTILSAAVILALSSQSDKR